MPVIFDITTKEKELLVAPFIKLSKSVSGDIVCDGINVVREAIKTRQSIQYILVEEKFIRAITSMLKSSFEHLGASRIPIYVLTNAEIKQIIGYSHHQGVMALLYPPKVQSVYDITLGSKVIALHDLAKSENVGSIIRNGVGLGYTKFVYTKNCASPFLRRAIKVAMGATFRASFYYAEALDEILVQCAKQKIQTIATSTATTVVSLDSFVPSSSHLLFFGNEGVGLAEDLLAKIDVSVTIPMENEIDSFNVASASAIVMHTLRAALK